jgi:L-asparaginase
LIEAGVHLHIREEYLYRIPAPGLPLHKADFRYGTVIVLRLYPGISEAFLRAAFFTDNVEAVILETFGSGNAPSSEWFLSVLRDARDKGIHVINVTQCIRGSVVMEKYRTGRNLSGLGVIDGRDSTAESALCKAMYLLGKGLRPAEFKRAFETSLRGEISEF